MYIIKIEIHNNDIIGDCLIVYYIQELLLDNEMIIDAKHLIEECIESIVNLISLSLLV